MAIPNINKPQTIFPSLPTATPLVDSDGNMNPYWEQFFQQLITLMQTYFKNEGFVIPQLSTSDIALLTGQQSIANIIYDSTIPAFKGNIAGIWKTFTLV